MAPACLSDDELNVLIREESFCDELDESIDALIARARLVERGEDVLSGAEWYSDSRAQWEELWQQDMGATRGPLAASSPHACLRSGPRASPPPPARPPVLRGSRRQCEKLAKKKKSLPNLVRYRYLLKGPVSYLQPCTV